MADLQILKKGYLFESLDSDELAIIAELVTERDIIAGDNVFDEGDDASSLYMIRQGTIEIRKMGPGGTEHPVAQLVAGSHFGEMAFVDHAKRAAAAYAPENTKVLEIKYADLEQLIGSNPKIGLKIYRSLAAILCRRIRTTTGDLSSLKELKLRHI
jgi:CRP-like cAMP-binding protein